MDRIKLGKITAPVGVRGEVRVYAYTDELTRFSAIKELWVEDTPAKIENARYQKNMVVLKLDICPDRNEAERLRNKELYLDRDKLWDVPEDTYFVKDIIGSICFDEAGLELGQLADIIQNPAQDIYVVKDSGGKEHLVPAVKEFIKDVDTDKKQITIHVISGLFDDKTGIQIDED